VRTDGGSTLEIVIELAFSAMSGGGVVDGSGLGVTLALGGDFWRCQEHSWRLLSPFAGMLRAPGARASGDGGRKRRGATLPPGARLAAPAALAQRAP
jgi:hypothetical protein